MKFFHISDLHIGKRVCGFSMLEDQRYILQQILDLAKEHRPDGILIAGDLYDKSMPSAEAVELVDWFLSQFAQLGIPVWAISGNHDSAERVAYASRMLEQAGIHMARVFDGTLQQYSISDEVDIYLMPYLRPAQVRRFYPEREIETTQQAVEAVLSTVTLRKDRVNILLMHQFLTGAAVCDSEELSVGGLDQVEASVVDAFDYVALGHLHRPQKIGRETVRYCGSPLKYSFSEAGCGKSVTVVETMPEVAERKGSTLHNRAETTTIPLVPRLDLREIRGPIGQLLQKEVYEAANREDYLHITLTDREEILDAIGKLREVYPNIMRLDFENRSMEQSQDEPELRLDEKTPQELFEEFFLLQNGREMTDEQKELTGSLMKEIMH
jgi:exonuclease SbcD